MELNATFNNISVISWWSVSLVEETGVPGGTISIRYAYISLPSSPTRAHYDFIIAADFPKHTDSLILSYDVERYTPINRK
jgi:hypothetical protein